MKVGPLQRDALEKGISLFNEGKYFDAHEIGECLWLRARNVRERHFLQGLIMAAGAFHHARKLECRGAIALLVKSIPLLRDGVDVHPDLLVSDFIAALEKLGSEKDWCTTTAHSKAFPGITRL